jgi:hypothetical protein
MPGINSGNPFFTAKPFVRTWGRITGAVQINPVKTSREIPNHKSRGFIIRAFEDDPHRFSVAQRINPSWPELPRQGYAIRTVQSFCRRFRNPFASRFGGRVRFELLNQLRRHRLNSRLETSNRENRADHESNSLHKWIFLPSVLSIKTIPSISVSSVKPLCSLCSSGK